MAIKKDKSEHKQRTTLSLSPKVKAMLFKDAAKQEMSVSEYIEYLARKNNVEWHVFKKIA